MGEAALSSRLRRLGSFDVFRLETLRPLGDVKAHFLTLIERSETVPLNGRKMNKYIVTTGLALDKPETFFGFEPFYSSLLFRSIFALVGLSHCAEVQAASKDGNSSKCE